MQTGNACTARGSVVAHRHVTHDAYATPAGAKLFKAWKKLPVVPGMGGAMDFVMGAQRFIVAMKQTAKGRSPSVEICAVQWSTETRRSFLNVCHSWRLIDSLTSTFNDLFEAVRSSDRTSAEDRQHPNAA